jgi:riboflavin synthase
VFTGIVQSTGRIESVETRGGDLRLRVHCPDLELDDARDGDSISVNGVCLTAVEISGAGFSADASKETMDVTTLAMAKPGTRVNLEKALTLSTPLGGHLVTGHVDGRGRIVGRREEARSICFRIAFEGDLAGYIARKGSICIDGVSLTVNAVDDAEFDVNIVPHTLDVTTVGDWRVGGQVNLEVDLIARYTERLIGAGAAGHAEPARLNIEMLEECGFVKNC